jgi:adenylosuccinate synthase
VSQEPRAFVVIDLGFGDAGKGLLTDHLVRRTGARLVVRFNGGAQAGHNVVAPDGRHHTFSQLGSGTFLDGVRTLLSRHVVVHPTALLLEAHVLESKGVAPVLPRLLISEEAPVITPYHQAANRLRELARGDARHGSCGVGFGEAVKEARERPGEAVRMGDLRSSGALQTKLARVLERERTEMQQLLQETRHDPPFRREWEVFESPEVGTVWSETATRLASQVEVVSEGAARAVIAEERVAVFEGAQGVLLDEWHGFHPFTTWSTCTAENALTLLAEAAPDARVERIGVLRAFMVRHGPGPLPSETADLASAVREHNQVGEWQGPVRYGWFDAVLARYALDVAEGVDVLAVTHLDVLSRLPSWKACVGYRLKEDDDALAVTDPGTGLVDRLRVERSRNLDRQARLTRFLLGAEPVIEACPAKEDTVLALLGRVLGRGVDWVARGPRGSDVAVAGGSAEVQ